ncbi:twin-arginine translocase TatA/TatE family subunit [Paenibacillus sp. HN-1]|uniref:twin-arginine translocase TatA/TatE family subunit n=1 Tax=Paenibacillus TaxID=44249 RepID=UPI001CA87F4B|nr:MULTISPECIES: twin-arginine translocase TatA/TatE family subunit [Paenibacillus]MBY9081253.1 twin-arginine translocase TatA/TatE family subunit [Paenibacillus sp. CGMCC 1.18879]MBY9087526.1 twin-arginine translocase TatA/TatE family subunit [Paenibacillus sinensis]
MLNGIGAPGIILLVIVALLLFGPNKLPELGRAVGRTFREFKEGTRDIIADSEPAKSEPAASAVPQNAPVSLEKRQPE